MKKLSNLPLQSVLALILLTFIFASTASFAASIKDRMKARLPEIKELKVNGIIGEDNKGFLFVREPSAKGTAIAQEENSDRQKVYTAIAKKQGATTNFVGKRRAIQIAQKAKTGVWLQDESGRWHQK